MSHYFESFLQFPQILVKALAEPKNNGLLRKNNIQGVILKQKGTRMAEDENWKIMTILKSVANFFKIHER